jgi:hypothetical protein
VVGGLTWGYHLFREKERALAAAPRPLAVSPEEPQTPDPFDIEPVLDISIPPGTIAPPGEPVRRPKTRPPTPSPEPPKPLALAVRVNRAIDRGVESLRLMGTPPGYERHVGLLGLTLLECGGSKKDPGVRRLADLVRGQRNLDRTYELALGILFLDRLGDPGDEEIIYTFGQRLLAGQDPSGSWSYVCRPRPARAPVAPKPARPSASVRHPPTDNSNTQFAVLGLWVAQRHGLSVSSALSSAARYFRESQREDGSWTYTTRSEHHKHSMTCAGLMCLATEYGSYPGPSGGRRRRPAVQTSDPAIIRGLGFLDRAFAGIAAGGRIDSHGRLYFLWSLERVAAVYDLDLVGGREWYPWAAEWLLGRQHADGSWSDDGPGAISTCFALLVLRRSNLAQDLFVGVPALGRRKVPDPLSLGPTVVEKPSLEFGPMIAQKPGTRKPGEKGTPKREDPPPLSGGAVIVKPGE